MREGSEMQKKQESPNKQKQKKEPTNKKGLPNLHNVIKGRKRK
jgi:hypothetical protein